MFLKSDLTLTMKSLHDHSLPTNSLVTDANIALPPASTLDLSSQVGTKHSSNFDQMSGTYTNKATVCNTHVTANPPKKIYAGFNSSLVDSSNPQPTEDYPTNSSVTGLP